MINAVIVLGYLAGIVLLGVYLSRYVQTDSDFFLAGRSLNKWVVAGTIIATDIAAIYIVGPAGNAYEGGAPVLLCGWTGNMIAALSAILFVPRLRRLRITTISEILEERYNVWIRLLPTVLWIVYYALFAGNSIYVFAVILGPILSLSPNAVIVFIGGGVILYCFFSGLLAGVYTDVIQTFLIILGGMIVLPLSLKAVGGFNELARQTPSNYFVFWRMDDTWPNYKTLLMFVMIGFPYWCTSQYMLQRCLAARSVRDASRGLMLAALFTGSITFAFILPGVAGYILYPPGELKEADSVLIRIFQSVLPIGLGGIFIAALLAANTSTASALLSSLSTLAISDIYRRFVPNRSHGHYLWVGRAATLAGGAVALLFAFNVRKLGGVIKANFEIMTFFEPPIFVIVAAALFWRGANAWGAALSIVVGVAFNTIAFLNDVSLEDRTFGVFPLCILALAVGSWLANHLRGRVAATDARTEAFFARMQGGRVQWDSVPGWLGLALSCGSLAAMALCMVSVDLVPRPANVLAVMGLVGTWVLGLYLAIPMFVSGEPDAEVEAGAGSVEHSLIYKIVGSGWSWLAVYAVSLIFMLALYFA